MLTKTSVEGLTKIPLFQQLRTDELRCLTQHLEEREYKKDEIVYSENEIPVFYIWFSMEQWRSQRRPRPVIGRSSR